MALPRRDRRDKFKEFFEDNRGIYSMTRLGFFLGLVLSGFVVVTCTLKGKPEEATELVLAINGLGITGKVIQKQIEESHQTPANQPDHSEYETT